ncbi:hypothetical protein WG66_012449, partial [Moniliophthora roreri]
MTTTTTTPQEPLRTNVLEELSCSKNIYH